MTILCVGNYPSLLTSRATQLAAHGYKVSIAINRHQAILAAGSTKYDAILICHTTQPDDARKLVEDLNIVSPDSANIYQRDWDDLGMEEIRDDNFIAEVVRKAVAPADKSRRRAAG
jgi:hypothetical protein